MPIYEYQCRECGRSFELIQKMSDLPCGQCPVCGGHDVEKAISTFAVVVREGTRRSSQAGQPERHGRCFAVDLSVPTEFRHPNLSVPLVRGGLFEIENTKPRDKGKCRSTSTIARRAGARTKSSRS
jgi:putative FmdB family regulatory protein